MRKGLLLLPKMPPVISRCCPWQVLCQCITLFLFSWVTEGQFDIPQACTDLAAVLSGDCTDTKVRPTVCGSACLHYSGLTDDDYAKISTALTF